MKISRDLFFAKSTVVFAFIFIPFWEVIASQFLVFGDALYSAVALIKYIPFLITILYCIILHCLDDRIKFNKSTTPHLLYFIVLAFHLVGDVNLILVLDAVKLQVLFVLFCLLIRIKMDQNSDVAPSIKFITITLLTQLIAVLAVGVFEFFDQEILVTLYGKSLEEMSHVSWMSSIRLISLLGNPINLGAFIVICISFLIHSLLKRKFIQQTVILTLTFISLFVVLFTLSRLALICLFVVLLLIIVFSALKRNYFPIVFMILPITWAIFHFDISNIDFGILADRFGNMLNDNEYSGNLRIYHWLIALNQIDNPFLYFWGLGLGKSNPAEEMVSAHGALLIENSFLTVFIETGLIGLILYLWCIVRALKSSWTYFTISDNPAFLIFYLVFILFSFGNDFNRNMPFSFYFWFFTIWLDWQIRSYSINSIKQK